MDWYDAKITKYQQKHGIEGVNPIFKTSQPKRPVFSSDDNHTSEEGEGSPQRPKTKRKHGKVKADESDAEEKRVKKRMKADEPNEGDGEDRVKQEKGVSEAVEVAKKERQGNEKSKIRKQADGQAKGQAKRKAQHANGRDGARDNEGEGVVQTTAEQDPDPRHDQGDMSDAGPSDKPNGKTMPREQAANDKTKQTASSANTDGIYPSLEELPSPGLPNPPDQIPGSFKDDPPTSHSDATNRTQRSKPKPKPKLRKSNEDDDPFVTLPLPSSPLPSEERRTSGATVRKPPKLTERPFGGNVQYSSPRRRGSHSETESDAEDEIMGDSVADPGQEKTKWPPIRTRVASSADKIDENMAQAESLGGTAADESRKTEITDGPKRRGKSPSKVSPKDDRRPRLSHQGVQTDVEMTVDPPGKIKSSSPQQVRKTAEAVASTSRVTLDGQAQGNESGAQPSDRHDTTSAERHADVTSSHQLSEHVKSTFRRPLDLIAMEKRRRTSVDYRRRLSSTPDLLRVGELSTTSVHYLGKLFSGGARPRHTTAGLDIQALSRNDPKGKNPEATRRHSMGDTGASSRTNGVTDLRIESLKRQALTRSPSLAPSTTSSIPVSLRDIPIGPLSIPRGERELIDALGVAAAIARIAQHQGFSEDVVWRIWNMTKSVIRTDEVVQAMREGAEDRAQEQLDKYIKSTDDGSDAEMVEVTDGIEGDGASTRSNAVDPSEQGSQSNNTPSRRRKPPFKYTPTRPSEEPESDWQPPASTRAAKTSRLFRQGRREEALERERRRVSRRQNTLKTHTPGTPENPIKVESTPAGSSDSKAGSEDVQMEDVVDEEILNTPFEWGDEHDQLVLHAGPDTEQALADLERQVDDDKTMRQHLVRLLGILHS